jgi:hypothetical protein
MSDRLIEMDDWYQLSLWRMTYSDLSFQLAVYLVIDLVDH